MSKRDLDDLLREAQRQGFTVVVRRSGHRTVSIGGKFVVETPSTPSDHRGVLNTRAALIRAGFKVRGRRGK